MGLGASSEPRVPQALLPPLLCQLAKITAQAELLVARMAAESSWSGKEKRAAKREDPGLCTLSHQCGCPVPWPKVSLC